MSIGKLAAVGNVNRDSGSAGIEFQNRAADAEAKAAGQPEPRNERVQAAAKMYEKAFLGEMVKAMRSTVSYGMEKPGMAENIYKDQLDEQYVDAWGEKGGIGLSDLIYNQIMERYFTQGDGHAIKDSTKQIALTDRDVSRVIRIKSTETPGQIPLRVELKKSPDGAPAKVQAPWDGEVVSNARIEGGKTALTMKHGPSLRSSLIFEGVASADMHPGTKLEKGRTVGVLSPEVHSFVWNINKDPDAGPARPRGSEIAP